MYKEHTLPSGDTISMTDEKNKQYNKHKAWEVANHDENGECRWNVNFDTQAEAEKEYVRFD
jgi:uncharacterized protein YpmB